MWSGASSARVGQGESAQTTEDGDRSGVRRHPCHHTQEGQSKGDEGDEVSPVGHEASGTPT